jgi:hypothetical protein
LSWTDLVDIGKFGQFWAKFAVMGVVEAMPEVWLKISGLHNSLITNPRSACSGSLESYNPSPQPKKVSKILQTCCVHSTLLKSTKTSLRCHCPLGIKNLQT